MRGDSGDLAYRHDDLLRIAGTGSGTAAIEETGQGIALREHQVAYDASTST